jgi:TrmH family RNA methyltransferase
MPFEKITSVKNEGIKQLQTLRDRKGRDASGLSLVDGFRELELALAAGVTVKSVYLCLKLMDSNITARLEKDIRNKAQALFEVTEQVFEKISFGDRSDGIVAVIETPKLQLSRIKFSQHPLLVIVEGVEKPGNLGAILRTCDAAGVDGLIVCDGRTDVYNPNVIRASLGAVFTVGVVVCTNQEALEYLRKNKIKVAATLPDAVQSYWKADYTAPTAILLGSEQSGLSDFWHNNADQKIMVPMAGRVNSLNVSITAAVMIYEVLRQRKS